ncbi:MAG: tryptophan--tRNA ligase [Candidatus Omnitrophica bacterium]|nr:tryptophan--tRNA ligase [Candidatus Omnitrophota bacterium]
MKQRVLSGMRPTGQLHLGHLVGALANWNSLQASYECFFMVADYHALMSEYEHPQRLHEWSLENVRDWLAAGIDPSRSVIFRQSDVPEHLELFAILAMLTPLGWVERVPTYKEQLREIQGRDLATYGFLGYPVLQAADILLYKAHAVPVGEDQLPHLELAREIVRRIHFLLKREMFPEPKALLTEAPKLLGTDGRKMSKSYGNTINLSESAEGIRATAQKMFTDPLRIKRTDPGHPETCNVCNYHKMLNPTGYQPFWDGCRNATRGCVENKRDLGELLVQLTEPFRAARSRGPSTGDIERILRDGAMRARAVAQQTIHEVKQAFGLIGGDQVAKWPSGQVIPGHPATRPPGH